MTLPPKFILKETLYPSSSKYYQRSSYTRVHRTRPHRCRFRGRGLPIDSHPHGHIWGHAHTYSSTCNKETREGKVSEVKQWHNQTTLKQASNQIKPTRKGYINTLAEESFKAIHTYDLKLPPHSTKPTATRRPKTNTYSSGLEQKPRNEMVF